MVMGDGGRYRWRQCKQRLRWNTDVKEMGIGRRKRFNEGTRGECIMKKPRQEKGGTLEEPPWLDIRAEME